MSVTGGIDGGGQPADEPVRAPKLAPTERVNDDFDLLIEEPPARRDALRPEGQSEVSPAELIEDGDFPYLANEITPDSPGSLPYEGPAYEGPSYDGNFVLDNFTLDLVDSEGRAYVEETEGKFEISGKTYEIDTTDAPDLFGGQ